MRLSWYLSWFLVGLWSVTGGGGGACGWEWSDFVNDDGIDTSSIAETLSMEQVSAMRVRDIKRRLARHHGYSADELGRMLDKKELIQALAFEEEKIRVKALEQLQRTVLYRGMLWATVAALVALFWPVLQQAKDMAVVNLEAYYDRKALEAKRCWELKSVLAIVGVIIMAVIDMLQIWLTMSVLLSWVISRNKYFFPIPNISVKPAELIGGQVEKAFGGYGINIGSVLVTYGLRFLHGQTEHWTGRAMLWAQNKQRQKNGKKPSSGKPKKKKPKTTTTTTTTAPPSTLPEQWMEPNCDDDNNNNTSEAQTRDTRATRPFPAHMDSVPQPGGGGKNGGGEAPSVPLSNAHFDFINNLNIINNNNNDDEIADEVVVATTKIDMPSSNNNMMDELD